MSKPATLPVQSDEQIAAPHRSISLTRSRDEGLETIQPSAPGSSHGHSEDDATHADNSSVKDKGTKDLDEAEDGTSSIEALISETSKGVREMEYLNDRLNKKWLVFLFVGFSILSYTLSLSELQIQPSL